MTGLGIVTLNGPGACVRKNAISFAVIRFFNASLPFTIGLGGT